jgi:hypothetical protein
MDFNHNCLLLPPIEVWVIYWIIVLAAYSQNHVRERVCTQRMLKKASTTQTGKHPCLACGGWEFQIALVVWAFSLLGVLVALDLETLVYLVDTAAIPQVRCKRIRSFL